MPRLDELFTPFDDVLTESLGLGIAAIRRIVELLVARPVQWMAAAAGASTPFDGPAEVIPQLRASLGPSPRSLPAGAGASLVAARPQLAAAAGVDAEPLDRLLELLAVAPGDEHAGGDAAALVRTLRARPVLDLDAGLVVPVPYNLPVAVRPALELLIRDRGGRRAAAYDDAKAKWVERRALDLVSEHLRPRELYRKLEYGAGGDEFERDGLAIVDLVGLAIEAKGGGLSPSARAGRPKSQEKAIERILREGAAQAQDLIRAFARKDPSITGIDTAGKRGRIEIGGDELTRFIPVVVTLEDLGGATARTQSVFSGLDASIAPPWVVHVDDLAWYAESLDLPVQLLHFAIVRGRIAQGELLATDEADWFRIYRAFGAAWIAEFLRTANDSTAKIVMQGRDTRRGKFLPIERPWRSPLHPVLERWERARQPNWTEASFAILDLSEEQAAALVPALDRAGEFASDDRVGHVTLRPDADPSTALHVLIVHAVGASVDLADVAEWIKGNAPDAERHVVLGAVAGAGLDSLFPGPVGIGAPARADATPPAAGAGGASAGSAPRPRSRP